jgi:hypothetical protein
MSSFPNQDPNTINAIHGQQIITLLADLHGYKMIYPCMVMSEDVVNPPSYRSIQADYIADEPPRYHTVVSTKQVGVPNHQTFI